MDLKRLPRPVHRSAIGLGRVETAEKSVMTSPGQFMILLASDHQANSEISLFFRCQFSTWSGIRRRWLHKSFQPTVIEYWEQNAVLPLLVYIPTQEYIHLLYLECPNYHWPVARSDRDVDFSIIGVRGCAHRQ